MLQVDASRTADGQLVVLHWRQLKELLPSRPGVQVSSVRRLFGPFAAVARTEPHSDCFLPSSSATVDFLGCGHLSQPCRTCASVQARLAPTHSNSGPDLPQVGELDMRDVVALRWPSGEGVPLVEDVVAFLLPYCDRIILDAKTLDVVRSTRSKHCRATLSAIQPASELIGIDESLCSQPRLYIDSTF